MKIYDCFTFFNELDLLEIRLNILDTYVDYFVLVESTKTHSGNTKELIFDKNKERFAKFSEKIIHIVVDDMPNLEKDNRWVLENFQREAIMRGLTKCTDNDLVLISDLDEIPNPDKITGAMSVLSENGTKNKSTNDLLHHTYVAMKKIFPIFLRYFPVSSNKIVGFKQNFYYYYINGFLNNNWIGTRAVLYRDLVENFNSSPQQVRESLPKHILSGGGWHFSYLLSPEKISEKIHSFAHSEFDKKEYTNVDDIKKKIASGKDLFGRDEKITYLKIDTSYPKWLLDNIDKYPHYIHHD
ncbi:MAG: hypothetical protein WCO48_02600 [Candidatus Taylorbacteria bacterium]